jgi:hypothetical protein
MERCPNCPPYTCPQGVTKTWNKPLDALWNMSGTFDPPPTQYTNLIAPLVKTSIGFPKQGDLKRRLIMYYFLEKIVCKLCYLNYVR